MRTGSDWIVLIAYPISLAAILAVAIATGINAHLVLIAAIFVLAVAAKVPWEKRFSLRTLLIAITLVAVALGLAAVFLRLW